MVELAARGDAGYVLLAGRYEGIDERLVEREVDEEIAIGDFVVSGGELPALMLIDAIVRQLPGALNDARVGARRIRSSTGCSIARTTRGRRCTTGCAVPDGAAVGPPRGDSRAGACKQALGRTWERRPDLLAGRTLSKEERSCSRSSRRAESERGQRIDTKRAHQGRLRCAN